MVVSSSWHYVFHRGMILAYILRRTTTSLVPRYRSVENKIPSFTSLSAVGMLEVEQKFVIADLEAAQKVETTLIHQGMTKKEEITLIDWYFDLESPTLTPQDNWLRFRQVLPKEGTWELKIGRRHDVFTGTTIYHEVEGISAIQEALNRIPFSKRNERSESMKFFEGFQVPELPEYAQCLIPFCRLETKRTSWHYANDDSKNIKIDIDVTNNGYLVGEVEHIVETDDQVENAQKEISMYINLLRGDNNQIEERAIGKLEYYLMTFRPDHYRACLEGGSLATKR
jgi:adenylate cyclase class IV